MLSDNQKKAMRNLITLLVVLLHLNACMLLNTRQRKNLRYGSEVVSTRIWIWNENLNSYSEPDPGTSKKINLNMFAYLKPIIGSTTYLSKY